MSKETPESKRLDVVRLYFSGLSYDDIAMKLGIGKATVFAIIQELRSGGFPQFEHVADLVNAMREVAVGLRKMDISSAEGINLFILLKRLTGIGVEPTQLESWVRMCHSVPEEEELAHSQIIQAAMKLAKLEAEGLSYEDVMGKLNSSSAELKKLEEKLQASRTELTQLAESNGSLTKVCRDLESERKRLEVESQKLAQKAQELSNCCQKLEKDAADRQIALSRLEEKDRNLSERLPRLEERAMALEKEIADRTGILKDLESLGFSRMVLDQLHARLVEMAARYGKEGLTARFLEDLGNYDSLLGLEATREVLTAEVDKLTKQRDSLSQLGEKLKLTPDEIGEGIAALKALQKKGVLPLAVVSYRGVLTSAGTDPQSFQKLVMDFGGVEQTLTARRGELETREQELETKRRALKELKTEEAGVKESIATLRESAMNEIKEMAGSAKAEVNALCQGMQQDITMWGKVQAEIGKYEEELKLARYFGHLPLTAEAVSNLVAEISPLAVVQYLTIASTYCREKLNPKSRLPRVIHKKYYTISEYTDVELVDIISWALLVLTEAMSRDKG